MYLTDLVFIEESMPPMERHMINFEKYRAIARVVHEIQLYQQTPYNLEPLPFVKQYLTNLQPLSHPYDLSPPPCSHRAVYVVCWCTCMCTS
jgi:son of sevenless-like protein